MGTAHDPLLRERHGDYLAVETSSNAYYRRNLAQVGSVCTTGFSREYLRRNCKKVAKAKVPGEWVNAIGL